MRCSWQELQETPAYIVQDWIEVMRAESEKAKRDVQKG